ncbi:hypothetical protein, partial [Acinetobacter baumannii]|uniref:hypothetical protein n=1 Tax=Acinetobacter baumannii TaxID=470 RepID=UPI001BC86E6A
YRSSDDSLLIYPGNTSPAMHTGWQRFQHPLCRHNFSAGNEAEKRGQAPYIRHPSPHQKYSIHRSSAVTRYQPYKECHAIQKINI